VNVDVNELVHELVQCGFEVLDVLISIQDCNEKQQEISFDSISLRIIASKEVTTTHCHVTSRHVTHLTFMRVH
jgi:hypothetical protein